MDAVTEALAHFHKLQDEDQKMDDAVERIAMEIQQDKTACVAAMRAFVDNMDPNESAQKLAEYIVADAAAFFQKWAGPLLTELNNWATSNARVAIHDAARAELAYRIEQDEQFKADAAQREDWE